MILKTATYLLEVGCEELPVSFIQNSLVELPLRLKKTLLDARLNHGQIRCFMTPRRIVIEISQLQTSQAPSEMLVKGPPLKVAQDAEGKWTQAAIGFATKMSTTVDQLETQEIDGVGYVAFLAKDAGQPVGKILASVLPDLILGLPGSHFMRWLQGSKVVFSRPVHWVVSLLDDQVLPLEIAGVQSDRKTRGHRFLVDNAWIEIPSANDYLKTLEVKGHVLVDQAQRKQAVEQQLASLENQHQVSVIEDEELLDHVIHLVESPKVLMGHFDSAYLKLPAKVIQTVMSSHQKYFALLDKQGKLAPHFVTIANNLTDANHDIIKSGNEKVLKARLEDASFFFDEDSKQKLEAYVENLKGISFQKNMGSLFDKTQRLVNLTPAIGQMLGFSSQEIEQTKRAALLCKADLATQLVRELTELQGYVGEVYAQNSGEPEEVCTAVKDYYLPRFAGDNIPDFNVGRLLSIVDKIDTLVAAFSQKNVKLPSGSKDPMGLRRLSLGLIRTLIESELTLNLNDALGKAFEGLGSLPTQDKEQSLSLLKEFFAQRLVSYLNYDNELVEAVMAGDANLLDDLSQAKQKMEWLETLSQTQQYQLTFNQLLEPANRIGKILSKNYLPQSQLEQVNPKLFENPEEQKLYDEAVKIIALFKNEIDGLKRFERLKELHESIAQFFDKTLVNAENPDVKQNRYILLSAINACYRQLADFTKITSIETPLETPLQQPVGT